jgi:murein L,D-transpeptidase YcbB/YkuD
MSQSIVLNWPELQSVLEPLIQQIVQKELNKLVSTPAKEVIALLPTDFWEALQQFRQETDLSEFALASTPDHSQEKMNQTQWQEFIRETSGSWPEMPMAEELREGWDNFTQRGF